MCLVADDPDQSPLKLISEKSERELEAARALEALRWPMKELAANLLRVVRGAGRAYELPEQMVSVLECMEVYRSIVGHYPTDYEISDCVNLRHLDRRGGEIDYALESIVQGALQVAASTLVGQSTQSKAGERELIQGVEELERAREENRKRYHGTAAEKAEIAERDALRENLRQRATELAAGGRKKPRQIE